MIHTNIAKVLCEIVAKSPISQPSNHLLIQLQSSEIDALLKRIIHGVRLCISFVLGGGISIFASPIFGAFFIEICAFTFDDHHTLFYLAADVCSNARPRRALCSNSACDTKPCRPRCMSSVRESCFCVCGDCIIIVSISSQDLAKEMPLPFMLQAVVNNTPALAAILARPSVCSIRSQHRFLSAISGARRVNFHNLHLAFMCTRQVFWLTNMARQHHH